MKRYSQSIFKRFQRFYLITKQKIKWEQDNLIKKSYITRNQTLKDKPKKINQF